MAKKYRYTILCQDGQKIKLGVSEKKNFKDFYEILNCDMIEVIPTDYYPAWMNKRATVYGDEEGRFKQSNIRNQHMKVLTDVEGNQWDTVGYLILEEVYHSEND